jgi:hypothetical protein
MPFSNLVPRQWICVASSRRKMFGYWSKRDRTTSFIQRDLLTSKIGACITLSATLAFAVSTAFAAVPTDISGVALGSTLEEAKSAIMKANQAYTISPNHWCRGLSGNYPVFGAQTQGYRHPTKASNSVKAMPDNRRPSFATLTCSATRATSNTFWVSE